MEGACHLMPMQQPTGQTPVFVGARVIHSIIVPLIVAEQNALVGDPHQPLFPWFEVSPLCYLHKLLWHSPPLSCISPNHLSNGSPWNVPLQRLLKECPTSIVDLLSAPLTIPLICCQIKSFRRASRGGEAMARRRKEERRAGL